MCATKRFAHPKLTIFATVCYSCKLILFFSFAFDKNLNHSNLLGVMNFWQWEIISGSSRTTNHMIKKITNKSNRSSVCLNFSPIHMFSWESFMELEAQNSFVVFFSFGILIF